MLLWRRRTPVALVVLRRCVVLLIIENKQAAVVDSFTSQILTEASVTRATLGSIW
jgi:hypothetical protein